MLVTLVQNYDCWEGRRGAALGEGRERDEVQSSRGGGRAGEGEEREAVLWARGEV